MMTELQDELWLAKKCDTNYCSKSRWCDFAAVEPAIHCTLYFSFIAVLDI